MGNAKKKECRCSLREKFVGDGCSVCNPEMAAQIAAQDIDDAVELLKAAGYTVISPDDQKAVGVQADPFAVDWSTAPKWAICHAFDSYGNGFWFSLFPKRHHSQGFWAADAGSCVAASGFNVKADNWGESTRTFKAPMPAGRISTSSPVQFITGDTSEGGDND